jgi:hypothetical protein
MNCGQYFLSSQQFQVSSCPSSFLWFLKVPVTFLLKGKTKKELKKVWFAQYNSSCKQVAWNSFGQKLCSVNRPKLKRFFVFQHSIEVVPRRRSWRQRRYSRNAWRTEAAGGRTPLDDETIVEGEETSFSIVTSVWTSSGPTTVRN